MMVTQSLVIYGAPIMASHENILVYPADFVLRAGVEVLIMNLAMIAAWWAGMRLFHPSRSISYALDDFNRSGAKGWARLGLGMIMAATAFGVLQGLKLLDAVYAVLPSGADSILNALLSVASACGFFITSMVIGGRESSLLSKALFWGLLVLNTMISASSFLLAGAAANLVTVAIGFFWSSGRFPWRYLTLAMALLSFFNIGKATMRSRYWPTDDTTARDISFDQLPATYMEWVDVSYNALLENRSDKAAVPGDSPGGANKNQTLLDRIDNLQNLLFVIDAIEVEHVTPLNGETYAIIPPLLIPRVLWPDKPRSHEGQILLNVHFGRQDLESTLKTYIAWGLLPEAYGNFGPIYGSIYLGLALGIIFAWVEKFTARKLVVSMEGFLSLCLMMNLLSSFEMVASVFVTSTFQSFIVIIAASLPFVHRTVTKQTKPGNGA